MVGRKQKDPRTGEGYKLAEYLNKNLKLLSGMTNDEVSRKCGYSTPNIISMWVTGKSKVPLDRLVPLAEMMNVNLTYLLPLWIEQYGGDRIYPSVTKAFHSAVSEDELLFVEALREITQGQRIEKITASQKKDIARVLGM